MTPEATKPGTAMATVDPVKVKGEIQAMFSKERPGFEEGIQPGELTIPRARMLQAMSAEVQQDPRKYRASMLLNSVTKEELTGFFIPIKRLPNNWIRFNARKKEDANYVEGVDPGAVVWRSDDPKDERVIKETQFGPKGEAPPAIQFMNFLCYFEGSVIPLVLSFGKTSYRAGQDFLTMAYGAGGAMYSRKYKLHAVQKTGKGGTYYVLHVEQVDKVSADELAIGEALYKAFANVKDVKVHEEGAGEEGDASFPHGQNA